MMSLETNDLPEEEKLFEHYNFTVDKGQGPVRIDRFLTDKIENLARNRIQNVANPVVFWLMVNL